jgi:hypothetical protein
VWNSNEYQIVIRGRPEFVGLTDFAHELWATTNCVPQPFPTSSRPNFRKTTMIPRLTITASLLFLAADSTWSAELYVDVGAGRDTNPGTAARPLKSLTAALDRATGGDTIFLQPGDYGVVNPAVGVDKHVFQSRYVTVQPAAGVENSRERISIQQLSFGTRSGTLTGEGRRGVTTISASKICGTKRS